MSPLKVIDLCAGTGAFSVAFEKNGFEVVFANDIEPKSKEIYDKNTECCKLTLNDITTIEPSDVPKHDIMTAGFPCQPFSIAGQQKGFQDERSNIFWSLCRMIEFHRPKCVVLENVKNLVSHDNKRTFKIIVESLENLNYDVSYKILNTADFGIPQHRERIYIICLRRDLKMKFDFSMLTKEPKRNLSDFLEKNVPEKYYYDSKSAIYDKLVESVVKENTVYQYRRFYVRENKSGECPTLTCNMGSGGHNVPIIIDKNPIILEKDPKDSKDSSDISAKLVSLKLNDLRIRKLTPKECFNLQGLSFFNLPEVADCHKYKLAGNAVSYPVVFKIVSRLKEILKETL
jgi:DNA (cytosine-5)-methyltransferase 1